LRNNKDCLKKSFYRHCEGGTTQAGLAPLTAFAKALAVAQASARARGRQAFPIIPTVIGTDRNDDFFRQIFFNSNNN